MLLSFKVFIFVRPCEMSDSFSYVLVQKQKCVSTKNTTRLNECILICAVFILPKRRKQRQALARGRTVTLVVLFEYTLNTNNAHSGAILCIKVTFQ